ncbi:hypothetical protein GGR57DRAFT_487073 [Xylariaceae sp. FL1272]|nr:hypothetical protein GGR57DRAFT_487073 [Xylariaceae sp. FL1272]
MIEPIWATQVRLSTVLIAIMSVYRIALRAIVDVCVSQAAWIWVSGFRKGTREAKLKDFAMFDEASRGLWGGLVLLWRLKGSHFACVGVAIGLLIQGFETFSSQMVSYDAIPIPKPTLPPPRAESWHSVVPDGSSLFLNLSTRAAIYDGILAASVSEPVVTCDTGNCTWPIYPSLAVCGSCSEAQFNTSCHDDCVYSMDSGTSLYVPTSDVFESRFTVASSSEQNRLRRDTVSRAVISTFDMMSLQRSRQKPKTQAYRCELWFCLQSYSMTATNGVGNRTVVDEWSYSMFSADNSEYVFLDIPAEMNTDALAKYSVPEDAVETLGNFMNKLMIGNATRVGSTATFDNDWIEAMEDAATKNLTKWISNLAASLTMDIQQTGAVDPERNFEYNGTAFQLLPLVVVNWYWVTYPISLMILAILYLMQTVWTTARDEVCAWKCEALPMLFCHVSKTIFEQVGDGMDAPGGLNRRVGQTEVELVREAGQWLFREPTNE